MLLSCRCCGRATLILQLVCVYPILSTSCLTSARPHSPCLLSLCCSPGGAITGVENPTPPGSYARAGSVNYTLCAPGTYQPSQAQASCLPCEAGRYCPASGMTSQTSCTSGAYWCVAVIARGSLLCAAPGLCVRGRMSSLNLAVSRLIPFRSPCSCSPIGSANPVPCPNGTLRCVSAAPSRLHSSAGAPLCLICAHGAPYGELRCSIILSPSLADPDSALAASLPCRSIPGGAAASDCDECTAGSYCGSTGLTAPTGLCAAGFYCLSGSPSANPGFPSLLNVSYGGSCPPGYYWCVPCTGSRPLQWIAWLLHCCVFLIALAFRLPWRLISHFCPCTAFFTCSAAGTVVPTACGPGTYQPSYGATSSSACLSCPAGSYCGTAGLRAATASCSPGYYCSGGASTSTQNTCPIGSFCNGTTPAPVLCAAGTYNNVTAQASCVTCPSRFYCDGVSTAAVLSCPASRYCPAGTGLSAPMCPAGTFSATPNLASASECTPCTPGSYCATPGLSTPTALCAAGFLCSAGAVDALGRLSANGTTTPCPAGGWCPAGASSPTSCPLGTYSNTTGNIASANCTQCDLGRYCGTTGLSAPTGLCSGGYWCARGNALPNPTGGTTTLTLPTGSGQLASMAVGGDICPPGYVCRAGSSAPTPCANGTFNAFAGEAVACATCPASYYCGQATVNATSFPCPAAYYCPAGTQQPYQYPCPAGRFSNATGLQASTDCAPCTAGSYCGTSGLKAPTGTCAAGYACYGGASVNTPNDGVTGIRCPAGSICPAGASVPTPCPAGSYCSATGLSSATAQCAAGYYCLQGASTATPGGQNNSYGLVGDVCPRGKYCPAGTVTPIDCPLGTFNNATTAGSVASCISCWGGYVCDSAPLTLPSKLCPATFYCPNGTISASLTCTVGSFCAGGNAAPVPCPAGSYADAPGLAACKACPARSYCMAGATAPMPCPAGYVCGGNTTAPYVAPCPKGSFSNVTSLASTAECTDCPPGQYCGSPGLTAPSGPCDEGFFCQSGSDTPSPGFAVCP